MLVLNYLTLATMAVAQFGFHYGRGKGGYFPHVNPSPPQLPSLKKTAMCVRRLKTFTCQRKISLKIGNVPSSIFKKHKPQYQPKTNEIPDSPAKEKPNQYNPYYPKQPIYNEQPNTPQPMPRKPTYDQGNENTDDKTCQKGSFKPVAKFEITMNSQADRSKIPAGQCTEWVDGRFYELTGQHITFSGRASDWDTQARQQGDIWDVSTEPKAPSIVVMKAGAQGASLDTGHVAIAESVSGSNICSSNWNSPTLGATTFKTIKSGQGIYFLTLKPGAKIEKSLKPHISVY